MQDVYELTLDDWNLKVKDPEVRYEAINGDLVLSIYGVLFLVQRENEVNNIICFRTDKSNKTFLQALFRFRDYLQNKQIQYLRVEGNLSRYFFLAKIKNVNSNYNVIQDKSIKNRNVFYVRLY